MDSTSQWQEAVENRGGQHVVTEDAAPFVDGLVAVMIIGPRSYRRETSWKTMPASVRSSVR